MKVRFCVDSGANIHSANCEIIDTEEDYGYSTEDWLKLSDEEKNKIVMDWAWEQAGLEIYCEEDLEGDE